MYAGAGFFAFCAVVVVGTFAYFAKDLPGPDKINKRFVAESTKIYDRTGETLLYDIHGEEKRTIIPFESIPEVAKFATIALEDQEFYNHHGIKFTSIARAALKNFLGREVQQGGSTITQQFIKNSVLTSERTLTRKIKEVILSIELEAKFSKDEILSMYLNEIPYGSNAYGIEAAAQTFFAKSAPELTLDEAAMLASLPKAPTRYSPYGSRREILKIRQEVALEQMAALGYITEEQAEQAKKVDVFAKLAQNREDIKAAHFVIYVREQLQEKYGEETLERGGLRVFTTLDWELQQLAERVVRDGALDNNEKWGAENAALVAIDPKTGEILAMAGSRGYFDEEIDGQVNVATRERQPGSSFKPFVYLAAFVKGYSPETQMFDVRTRFGTANTEKYEPANYDGRFRGLVQMKDALGQSLNIPAVKTLYLVGLPDAIALAKRLGITSLRDTNPERFYGLSLVLGGGEVQLLDHVAAFATMANGGIKQEKTPIVRIEDGQGKVLEKLDVGPGERVVPQEALTALNHILSTNSYRAPAFGDRSPLRFDDRAVAAKTGTTNEFRDGWTMGYTPDLAVGVWAGNNDNRSMRSGAAGVNVAAPIWRAFLDEALTRYEPSAFAEYDKKDYKTDKDILDGELEFEDEKIKVCKTDDGEYCKASDACPDDREKKRIFASARSILYYVDTKDPLGDEPDEPKNDPQFKAWEDAVEKFYDGLDDKVVFEDPPEDKCDDDDFEDSGDEDDDED